MKTHSLLLASLLFTTSCASIVSGTEQVIEVTSIPSDAKCDLERLGKIIGTVPSTPGSVKVDKTKDDITVICTKKGYEETKLINKSGNEGSTLGNVILGGGVGWAVDSARGADNKYTSPVNVVLIKR